MVCPARRVGQEVAEVGPRPRRKRRIARNTSVLRQSQTLLEPAPCPGWVVARVRTSRGRGRTSRTARARRSRARRSTCDAPECRGRFIDVRHLAINTHTHTHTHTHEIVNSDFGPTPPLLQFPSRVFHNNKFACASTKL